MSGGTRHLFRDGFIGIGDPMFGVASRHERASALGTFGSVIGVAAVAGQILGGTIISRLHGPVGSAAAPGRRVAGEFRAWEEGGRRLSVDPYIKSNTYVS